MTLLQNNNDNKSTEVQMTNSLSNEETKQILTPFAFEIDKSLFGLPLSVPWKRGVALLIDFILIAILAETPGELLALVVAITFFKLGSKKRAAKFGKKRGLGKLFLRMLGAFILFVVLVSTLPDVFEQYFEEGNEKAIPENIVVVDGDNISVKDSLALAGLSTKAISDIANSDCQQYDCWLALLTPSVEKLATFSLKSDVADELIDASIEEVGLPKQEKQKLKRALIDVYQAVEHENAATENVSEPKIDKKDVPVASSVKETKETTKPEKEQSEFYKGLEWVKETVKELGVNFGWAALYFTLFTAIWNGQTPGKKMLNIRVIQLDGTPLSVWDSFGRYGGYAAGLATGFMGFLQIYWDPNRQAIHDKISATIVIDVKKAVESQQKL